MLLPPPNFPRSLPYSPSTQIHTISFSFSLEHKRASKNNNNIIQDKINRKNSTRWSRLSGEKEPKEKLNHKKHINGKKPHTFVYTEIPWNHNTLNQNKRTVKEKIKEIENKN